MHTYYFWNDVLQNVLYTSKKSSLLKRNIYSTQSFYSLLFIKLKCVVFSYPILICRENCYQAIHFTYRNFTLQLLRTSKHMTQVSQNQLF